MSITTTQKIIKIGTSKGVTIPAKQLKELGVETGDELEVTIRKKIVHPSDSRINKTASDLLKRYEEDFTNLSQR